jgi:hypothetical protein
LDSQLTEVKAENVTLKGDYMLLVVEIVIGGVPTILEICFVCLIMSLGRIELQGSVSTDLFGPMRHQVDLSKVDVRM